MKNFAGLCILPCLFMCGGAIVAQESPSEPAMGPPKVLVVEREMVKPGKSGSVHEKSEAAFVNAMRAAKWPTHYVAINSMSGSPRSLFLLGYPSFDAWEKDNHAMEKNTVLSTAFDKAAISDGELLTGYNQAVFTLDTDGSLPGGVDIAHARYFEVSQYVIKPGHRKEWVELVKMYHDGFQKGVPNVHWALYDSYYGENNGGVYVVISLMKSLSEDDDSMGDSKKLQEAVGADGMKRIGELTASCVESQQTNLFEISPKMSYAADEWIKADAAFWKPKAAAAPAMAASPMPAKKMTPSAP